MFGQARCPKCRHYQVKRGCWGILSSLVGLAVLTVGLFFVCLALSSQYKLLYSCITLVLVTAGFVIMLVPFFSPLLRLFGLGYECEFCGYKL